MLKMPIFPLPRWDATYFLWVMPVTRGVLSEGVLVRSSNPRLGHVAPAVDTFLEAYERVANTSLGLHSRIAPNVYQEPISRSGKLLVA